LRRYEAMFLFDNTAAHQWSEMEAEVRRLCGRINANLLVCLKFDERKLAYEIKGRKRGTYVLTYFEADPARIAELERDARLSELILRTLVLRADGISEERLAELKARPPDQALQPISGEGRRGEGGPGRGRQPAADVEEPEAAAPAGAAQATEDADGPGTEREPATAGERPVADPLAES